MAKVTGKDGDGNTISLNGLDLSYGLEILDIDNTEEWTLTTTDDTPATYTSDHVGGRPDDRS